MISDGYGVAIPTSGIAMGAVFENVTIPVQGGVGVGRLGWLLRLGAAVPAQHSHTSYDEEEQAICPCHWFD